MSELERDARRFSPDPSIHIAWNVDDGWTDDGTAVICFPLDSVKSNSIWILTAVNTSTPSTQTQSMSSTALPSATAGASSGGGLDEADKIEIGASIGGLLLALVGLYLAYLAVKRDVPSWLGWLCCHQRSKDT
ncbi:hypothetical protein HWV62_40429 [Athelia sp. TMB]|nr:hypothetical protein HWV62_40429 [Athelia sp. TMB]